MIFARASDKLLTKPVSALPGLTLLVCLLLPDTLLSSEKLSDKDWPKTDFSRRNIELSEIMSGGPPKDGIPAIDKPNFIPQKQADNWLGRNEPVIVVSINAETKAYPLQILIYHEIVNDIIGGLPVSVTFCPLCNASIVFDRRMDDRILDFGTTGKLRKSDMIMYDRQTESWWQQFLGRGLIGHYMGKKLKQIASTIVSYETFKDAYPNGTVLSQNTGYYRPYGNNPYRGYDTVGKMPFLYSDPTDSRLPAMERVLGIEHNTITKIYPFSILKQANVINDHLGQFHIVVFSIGQMHSPLDKGKINQSRKIPAAAAYSRILENNTLEFYLKDNKIFDKSTGTQWNILGQGINGKLKGKKLKSVDSGVHFAFAWLAFKPNSIIYSHDGL